MSPIEQTDPDTGKEFSTTDILAQYRTTLANERTVLAYVRTALALAGAGLVVIKFFRNSAGVLLTGWGLIGVGVVVLALGLWRYAKMHARILSHGIPAALFKRRR